MANEPKSTRLLSWLTVVMAVASLIVSGIALYLVKAQPQETSWEDRFAQLENAAVRLDISLPNGKENGSGVVVDASGLVLTNRHVVANALLAKVPVQVSFNSGETYNAEIKGVDPRTDVALLQLTGVPAGKQFSYLTPFLEAPALGGAGGHFRESARYRLTRVRGYGGGFGLSASD